MINIKLACRIHIMAGKVAKKAKSNYETYEANLRYAESKFQSEGIIGLIEPLNKYSVPEYFMSSYDKGIFFHRVFNFKVYITVNI